MAGQKGYRFVTPNTQILSHRFWTYNEGSHAELLAARRGEDILYEKCMRHYIKHSKYKSKKQIEKNLLHKTDLWLTPEEAVGHGIADGIVDKFGG